ncbi:MAG: outer membrane lipoprotein carrier protein LolA [Deltaproteobacteria bacterium]|nr:outer membrane lipoprotein carrier protein LolA [Deltaproteobacteria bacterium]
MKKDIFAYLFVFVFAFLFFQPANVQAEKEMMRPLSQTEREGLLSRLKSIQAGIKTFEADFIEDRTIKALPSPLTYEGTLYYDRGNLFFMKYVRPVHYILRVKGTEVIIYVVGSRTADSADMSGAKGGAGHTDIFNWDPSSFHGQIYSDADGFWLKESAQKSGAPKLNILLDKKTLLVKHFSIIGENGDTTKITFSDKKVNQALPSEVLNYSLPKGTKLNRLSPP